jgi:hypothetical protein
MSKSKILDFLKGILDVFIKKFPDFVSGLFKKIPEKLQSQILVFIKLVENIKNFVDSPASDFLTTLIPGEADDNLKAWLRKVLPGVLKSLNVITVNNDESIRLHLPDDSDAKNTKLADIATLLTKSLTGASLGQSRITSEVVFQDYKKRLEK